MGEIIVKKDGEGFLAEVNGYENLFAYGETESLAKKELLGVVEMTMDYHLEQVENERKIKNNILKVNSFDYALQV